MSSPFFNALVVVSDGLERKGDLYLGLIRLEGWPVKHSHPQNV